MEQFEKEIKGYNLQKAINVDTGFGLPIEETIKDKINVDPEFEAIVIAFHKGLVSEEVLEKARSGIYKDTPENKKQGRVGTRYGNAVNGGQVHDLESKKKREEVVIKDSGMTFYRTIPSDDKKLIEVYKDALSRKKDLNSVGLKMLDEYQKELRRRGFKFQKQSYLLKEDDLESKKGKKEEGGEKKGNYEEGYLATLTSPEKESFQVFYDSREQFKEETKDFKERGYTISEPVKTKRKLPSTKGGSPAFRGSGKKELISKDEMDKQVLPMVEDIMKQGMFTNRKDAIQYAREYYLDNKK